MSCWSDSVLAICQQNQEWGCTLSTRVTRWTLNLGYLRILWTCWRQNNKFQTHWCLSTIMRLWLKQQVQSNLWEHCSTDSMFCSDHWNLRTIAPNPKGPPSLQELNSRLSGDQDSLEPNLMSYTDLSGNCSGHLERSSPTETWYMKTGLSGPRRRLRPGQRMLLSCRSWKPLCLSVYVGKSILIWICNLWCKWWWGGGSAGGKRGGRRGWNTVLLSHPELASDWNWPVPTSWVLWLQSLWPLPGISINFYC